jgi:hypothetical protein
LQPSRNRIRPDTCLHIKGCKKISTCIPLYEILYTDSQDMLVPAPTITLHYYNYCTASSTSPGN